MSKIKNIHKTTKYIKLIAVYVCIFTASYMSASFVNLDINCINWNNDSRAATILIPTILTFATVLLDYLNE